MSIDHHRGSAWAFNQLMEQAKREIEAGERKGAAVRWKTANPAKVMIGWFRRRLLRGEFRRRV